MYIIATQNQGSVLAGFVTLFSGSTSPNNWVESNGQELSKTKYPQLFSAIGETYGSRSFSTFTLPDFGTYKRLEYESWWDNWPCIKCKEVFLKHNKDGWRCKSTSNYVMQYYYPMDNLEYLEYKELKND